MLLLTIVPFYFFKVSYSQENDYKTPIITLIENYIDYSDFPGISKDGNYIINVHSDYSCCISTETKIELRNVKTEKIESEIMICPSETDEFSFTEAELKTKYKAINTLLAAHKFQSMPELCDYSYEQKGQNKAVLTFVLAEKKYISEAFELPIFSSAPYCCGFVNDSVPCMVNTKVHKVWYDLNLKVLFVSYGVVHQVDGCDIGPFYKILGLREE